MALCPSTLDSLGSYWTNRLSVDDDAFDCEAVTVGPANEGGIQLFRRGEALVVGAPKSRVAAVRERLSDCDSAIVTEGEALRRRFESLGTVTAVFDSTFYGYADQESFAPVLSDARLLTVDDHAAYERLRTTVPDEEWSNGGSQFEIGTTVGLFDGDELVAVAGYEVWDDFLAHIAVVVHPNHRGNGHGRAVVSEVTEQALVDGLLPQYRTADEWPWSVALAESLGFERFVTAALVQLE